MLRLMAILLACLIAFSPLAVQAALPLPLVPQEIGVDNSGSHSVNCATGQGVLQTWIVMNGGVMQVTWQMVNMTTGILSYKYSTYAASSQGSISAYARPYSTHRIIRVSWVYTGVAANSGYLCAG